MTPKTPQLSRDPDETTDVTELIQEIVPDADTWQKTPNPALGGARPIDLIKTEKESILRDMLRAAKYGMAS